MIAVVKSTGGCNLKSVGNALDRIDAEWILTDSEKEIKSARLVILPGVGAAPRAMQKLENSGLTPTIKDLSQPVLGICLGMQLLFERSEEENTKCLSIIPSEVRLFKNINSAARIPHMGWNEIVLEDRENPLCRNLPQKPYMYFVHSFRAQNGPWVVASSSYGETFPAIVQHRNFYGCQFHPEKSGEHGLQIMKNFVALGE